MRPMSAWTWRGCSTAAISPRCSTRASAAIGAKGLVLWVVDEARADAAGLPGPRLLGPHAAAAGHPRSLSGQRDIGRLPDPAAAGGAQRDSGALGRPRGAAHQLAPGVWVCWRRKSAASRGRRVHAAPRPRHRRRSWPRSSPRCRPRVNRRDAGRRSALRLTPAEVAPGRDDRAPIRGHRQELQ